MISLKYLRNNWAVITVGEFKLYYSYEQLVAFNTLEEGMFIVENYWGTATGKHLNSLDPDKKKRLPGDKFMEEYKRLVEL